MKRRSRPRRLTGFRRNLAFEPLDPRLLLAASDVSRVPFWDGETTDPAGPLINRMGGPVVSRAGGATVARETGIVHSGGGAFQITTNGTLPAHSFDFFSLSLTGFGPSAAYVDTRDMTGFEGIEFWVRNQTGKSFNLVFEIKDYRDSNDHRARFTSQIPAAATWTPISMSLVLDAAHGWQVSGSPDLSRTKLFALVIETGADPINGSFYVDDMLLVEKGGPLNPATADGNALVDRLLWRSFRGLWGSRDPATGLVPSNSAQADDMATNSTAGLIAMLPTAVQQGKLTAAAADAYVSTVVDTLNTVWDNVAATGNGGFVPPRYLDRVTLAATNLREESSVDAALLFLPLYTYQHLPTTPLPLRAKIDALLDRFDFAAFSSPAGWKLAYRYDDHAFTTGTYDGYSTEVYVISLAAHLATNHRVDIATHWNSANLRGQDHLVDPAESHLVHSSPDFRPPFAQWLLSLLVDVRGRGADTYPNPDLAGNPYWNAVEYQREVERKLTALGRPTFVQPDAGDDGTGTKYEQFSMYANHGEPDLFMPWSVGFDFLADPEFAEQALRDISKRDFHGPLGLSDSVRIATGAATPTVLTARTEFWNQALATLALMQYRYGSNEFLTELPEIQAALDKVLPPVAPFGSLPQALATSRNWIAFTPRNYNPNLNQFPTEAQLRADLQQLYDDGWRGIVTYTLDGTLRHVPRLAKEVGFTKVVAGLFWYDTAQLGREKAAVAEVDPFVDAYVVGNEGLLEGRYTRAALQNEIAALQLLTGKPVTTTETGGQYLADPTLLDEGDWVFPNIQPFCSQPAIRNVTDAVTHTTNEFLAIRSAALARNPARVVALKETWWPTAGDAAATQANQAEYFRRLAQTQTAFAWGESFDQPWKFEPGCYNQGPTWGLYTSDGDFKAVIPQLHTVYVSGGERVETPDSSALHRGMSLPLWNANVNLTQLGESLANLKNIGVDWVAVNVFWFQDNIHSEVIEPDTVTNPYLQTASDDSVRAVIDAIHALGMKVMLKPLVNLRHDPTHWRGEIVGSDAWFRGEKGYVAFMRHYANLAAEKHVELLAVGTELVAAANAFESPWRTLISEVRSAYPGALVYAAQHGGDASVTSENVAWWDALDYIGLDAYYPLTDKSDPTPSELRSAWADRATMIKNWLDGLDPDDRKPILFTEIGYRSWDGTNQQPADQAGKGDTQVDLQEQADCYDAVFAELWGTAPWLQGLYWWNWEVDPHPNWEADNWYTPQDKPAQRVLAEYYLPWRNPDDRFDVDAQDGVTPLDVLLIINRINTHGSGPVPVRPSEPIAQRRFYDVSGDNVVAALDVLQVINFINARPQVAGEGEDRVLQAIDTLDLVFGGSENGWSYERLRPVNRRDQSAPEQMATPTSDADTTFAEWQLTRYRGVRFQLAILSGEVSGKLAPLVESHLPLAFRRWKDRQENVEQEEAIFPGWDHTM